MDNENALTASGAVDPAAIELIGTHTIDLTATTHPDIPLSSELRPIDA